ncbi:circularly permuted type 2 ATP-grasp protein [Desulfobulbus rhabdoformis]|uniref:circularly permuted type 2 ATP-grasp protein n=1 Tax=Desulfobulbus rhabdoformis TaxID=34032 RepID=UPI00196267B2|nr:circularly permuted type 2 ATP-grasp protein [Desulfobulbus rhabdoformis]MBM9614499.1 circularly permuted type 2 ATP-grasp protein [Desulfobulbus rhabdoformis]
MNTSEFVPASPSLPGTSLLLSDVFCSQSAHYCEAFAANGQPRPHWLAAVEALNITPLDALIQLQERGERMRHEDGATYNPFDAPDGRGTPWALEMIPLPMTSTDWQVLEQGLLQRARLMERVLADVYGPQNLLRSGQLPAELIYANPQFIRACNGIRPPKDRYLSLYAVDCYRDPQGRFRVLRDFASCPMGLGYTLENRIIISRLFAELYHHSPVCRLAPFFRKLHNGLVQRCLMGREDPNIVLLSPGPDSPIYFEQAFLSRYLGYPLVEGQDLTVRNGRLFLKKLAGLEPVDSIFRQIADLQSDPFTLGRDTGVGVAGLIQVAREQNIDITNPIGAGFIETPSLQVFLQSLCPALLGEELLLQGPETHWCGESFSREEVKNRLEEFSLWPALSTTGRLPADAELAMETSPSAVMARGPIQPSMVPVWNREKVEMRPVLLRLFLCATDEGFMMLPGGMAMTGADQPTLLHGVPEQLQSKDIWVLSEKPVESFSLLSGLNHVEEFRRFSDLPSRVADHMLWLGRYLERAEGLIRLLRGVYRRLASETRPEDIPELEFLLNLLRSNNTLPPLEEGKPLSQQELEMQLVEVFYREDRPESVIAILKRVQEAARNVRDRLNRDSWRVINQLEEFGDNPTSDPLDLLESTLFTLSAFSGLAMEGMTRSLGWRFMDMGRRIERALHQIDLIRFGLPQVCAVSHNALESLLEVSDSIMTYRARYRTAFQLAPVLDLLLLDESNPKSLAFQLSQLALHVEELPRSSERRYASNEERMTLEMLTNIRLLDLTELTCRFGSAENEEPLHQFLETMESNLFGFVQQISAHYLTRVTSTPYFPIQLGEPMP